MEVLVGDAVPKYAILSHTWVEGEEVEFREFSAAAKSNEAGRLRSGHRKILRTCLVAKTNGIDYVWIDTCCIDKSNSSELNEAINSMFKWYQNAEVCYAYLSDLPVGCDLEITMRSCRWFTRGWCLQELLAPKTLHLYDEEWNFVGSKIKLGYIIQAITGIDRGILSHHQEISWVPTAVKMSWASHRSATRVEDVAYCLMGIFEVNMPLLYGEGQKAFVRLQEEIIKRSNDLTIFWNFVSESSPTVKEGESSEIEQYPESSDSDTGSRLRIARSYERDRARNLFASSPRDFSKCGQTTAQYALYS